MKTLILLLIPSLTWGAARGSGSYTNRLIGPSTGALYLPAAREEPGWGTDTSTNSVNLNFIIISSAVYDLQTLGGNTNYIRLQNNLQTNATFYVSSASVDGQTLLSRSSGNVGISTSTPGALFMVGNGLFSATSGGNIGVSSSAPGSLFVVGGGTLAVSSNGRVALSSASPVNTLGVTGGGHFSSSVTASAFFGDGSNLTGSFSPTSGSTNYIQNINSLQAGSTFYVASGTVNSTFTVLGHTFIGDASGDLLTMQSSSITLINATTIFFNNMNSAILFSSSNITSKCVWDQDGIFTLIKTSVTTDVSPDNSTALTIDLSTYAATGLGVQGNIDFKMAWILSTCEIQQDATGEGNNVILNLESGDSVGALGAELANIGCYARADLANEYSIDSQVKPVRVDSSQQIRMRCQNANDSNLGRCILYLAGVCQ